MMIDVSCAIIVDQHGKTLVAQRSLNMRLPLKWEFPGGKVESQELPEACLMREIFEELDVKIEIVKSLSPSEYETIRLIPFICSIKSGEIKLAEHAAFLWLEPEELSRLDWAEADIPILQQYLDHLKLFPDLKTY